MQHLIAKNLGVEPPPLSMKSLMNSIAKPEEFSPQKVLNQFYVNCFTLQALSLRFSSLFTENHPIYGPILADFKNWLLRMNIPPENFWHEKAQDWIPYLVKTKHFEKTFVANGLTPLGVLKLFENFGFVVQENQID
jgi:hypothetical protein